MKKIIEFCEKYDMLPRDGTVLAAVSGGKDSMYLLHVLMGLAPDLGFTVECAHFDHGLRGAESQRDAAFVADFCAAKGIPCHTESGDVAAFAAENGLGVEEAARILRYDFLERTADKIEAARIATAHTADDNIETLLLNLARGTGLKGLCGIPPVRGRIVRPLLQISTDEIISYLGEIEAPFVEDSTNQTDNYTRNKIRHHLVPALREINPAFDENALRCIGLLREDEAFLSALAEDFVAGNYKNGSLPVGSLCGLPAPIAGRALQKISGGGLSAVQLSALLAIATGDNPHASVDVSGATIHREYDRLIFGAAEQKSLQETVLEIGQSTVFDAAGLTISAEEILNCTEINNSDNNFCFQRDSICGRIVVRVRKEGDCIRLAGRNCTKSLKKLFSENRLNGAGKQLVPVLCDDKGIIAVSGFGIAERCTPRLGDDIICVKIERINKT